MLGIFPAVALADRVYVDVDGLGGYVYTRLVGGVECNVTNDELEDLQTQWRMFYTDAALEQVRATKWGVPDDA